MAVIVGEGLVEAVAGDAAPSAEDATWVPHPVSAATASAATAHPTIPLRPLMAAG
ncbi:hypothetical protein N802_12340 [Knoellia sinensis KCTC 19936]|uniref:Uncharacterized protein n=1 Tax=Knoellia sinensis KCTC 19936 TaxID=1385520 RepID=A0A0A0JAC2_9MICO|nr:hypothetical protein N802_12340 [Knoellia sinensis KCTC 19936]